MSNWIEIHLEVLASSREEIDRIELALREPCEGLISWRAQTFEEDPTEIAEPIKQIVSFKAIRNLGDVDPSLVRWRRFKNSHKDRFRGLVRSHLNFVSESFGDAIFLVESREFVVSYTDRSVIYGGDEIRSTCDADQQVQGLDWILPDIFAPFKSEYVLDLEPCSLWDEWIEGLQREVAELRGYGKQGSKLKGDHGV